MTLIKRKNDSDAARALTAAEGKNRNLSLLKNTDEEGASLFEPDLVTVIIPSYNRKDLLVEAIESVRRQTWSKIQIIVVDDGSTDGTRALVEPMRDVEYVWQPNKGQAAARNTGLTRALGEFICTLDSDDLWFPDFLKESVTALREMDADFVFSNWFRRNNDGTQIRSYFEDCFEWWESTPAARAHWRTFNPDFLRESVQRICFAPSSAFVFRRHLLLSGWAESVAITDDWAMLQDILVENRCRVAVRMERAWVKRVFADNICDVETIEVRRAMGIDSPLRLLRTKYHRLSRRERAKLCRLLVAHSIRLHREEAKTQENLLRNAQVILSAVAVSFLNSPVDSIIRIFKRGKWRAVITPERELKFEGLLEPPDTMALPNLGILSAPSSKKISSTFSTARS